MGIISLVLTAAGLVFGFLSAKTFWGAGNFKLKGTKEAFAAAGFGWAEKTPLGAIKLVGFLEVLGAIGVIVAPIVALIPGLEWAQYVAVAAALGLVATMLGAMLIHGSRKESKYTFKMNFKILIIALVAAVLYAFVQLPLAF